MTSIGPAISMCSTADDMTTWLKYHLHGHQELLPRDIWADLHTTVTAISNSSDMYTSHIHRPWTPVSYVLDGYALGWFTGHYRGEYFKRFFRGADGRECKWDG